MAKPKQTRRHHYRKPYNWTRILRDFEASGLKQSVFARESGLNSKTLSNAINRTRQSSAPSEEKPAHTTSATSWLQAAQSTQDIAPKTTPEPDPVALEVNASGQISAIRVAVGSAAFEMVGDLEVATFTAICKELAPCLR